MHFAKLRLSGFKSFVDPTELLIEPGLTGIVGPNGCGKSNLVEALVWAMGETSAKRLRGGEMDDVIFGGTAARPSRNLAEVTLALDNARHDAPKPFDEWEEIEIVRRIERGGGSGYRINGREVRARDVQLLFADAASGSHSAALVTQGRVSAIIAAKPADRRALLEEAAGITGLHSRRHEAELRLRAAEANLLRLEDVLTTLVAQLEGLRKQAKQAQRYRRLSEQVRRAEAVLLHLRWQAAEAELAAAAERLHAAERIVADHTAAALAAERGRDEAAAALPPLRQDEAAAGAELQRLVLARQALEAEERRIAEAHKAATQRLTQLAADLKREEGLTADATAAIERLEAERAALAAGQNGEGTAQNASAAALEQAAQEVQTLESELTRLTEQVAAGEARRAALQARAREAQERQNRLTQRQDELARQRLALDAEVISADRIAEATEAVRLAEAEVERSRAAGEAAEEALRAAQAAETTARAPMEAVETRRAKLRTEAQALSELLAAAGDRRWRPVLDAISVAPGFEAALGAALGEDLTAPVDAAAPMHWHALDDYSAPPPPLPEGAAPLAAQVTGPPALARRLAQIGIAADAAAAERLQPALQPGQRLVSIEGGLWRWDGFRRLAGTPTAAAQRLRQRNRLAELQEAQRGVEAEAQGLVAAFQEAQQAARNCVAAERTAREAARASVGALAQARDRETQLARKVAGTASRLAALDESAGRLATDLAEAKAEGEKARDEVAGLPDPGIGREAVAALRARLAERRTQHQSCRSDHERLLREAQARRQRLAAVAQELASWQGRAEAAARQQAALQERRAALDAEIEGLARRPAEIAAQREALAETIAQSTARRNQAADALSSGETRLTDAERAAKAADAALAAAREERVRCEGHREQAEETHRSVAALIAERLDCPPESILAAVGAEEEKLPEIGDAQTRLDRLTRERDNMGPVNLVAEAEATEVEEKLALLTRERDDLTGAIARLRQGIAALNREGRERLVTAFAEVNEHFTKLFVRLFGGGHAYLKLDYAEGEDPLAAGLEIMASPPGKKLQVLSLLSGGEQALTALSLLFAVFLTNPAPICVLDEVDAPLDDANVDRFCSLVHEIAESAETRFLVITHHRLTMARVDRLFGVTMAERGVSQLVSVDLQQVERFQRRA